MKPSSSSPSVQTVSRSYNSDTRAGAGYDTNDDDGRPVSAGYDYYTRDDEKQENQWNSGSNQKDLLYYLMNKKFN